MYAVMPEPGEAGEGHAPCALADQEGRFGPTFTTGTPNFFHFSASLVCDKLFEAIFFTETPFERYLYFIAFKHSREETPEYLKFFSSYIDTTPAWEGTGDNSDVLHPSLVASLDYPYFYNHTYVHFLPGGYVNSKTVRMSYLGNSKFTFLNETYVDQW